MSGPFDPHGYSDNFFAFADDISGGGWTDLLVYGFPGKDASWFENSRGVDRFWPRRDVDRETWLKAQPLPRDQAAQPIQTDLPPARQHPTSHHRNSIGEVATFACV